MLYISSAQPVSLETQCLFAIYQFESTVYMCERFFSKLTCRSKVTNEHPKQLIQLAASKSAVDYTSLVDEKRFLSILNWDTSV